MFFGGEFVVTETGGVERRCWRFLKEASNDFILLGLFDTVVAVVVAVVEEDEGRARTSFRTGMEVDEEEAIAVDFAEGRVVEGFMSNKINFFFVKV